MKFKFLYTAILLWDMKKTKKGELLALLKNFFSQIFKTISPWKKEKNYTYS
jgi:hypothetical protein